MATTSNQTRGLINYLPHTYQDKQLWIDLVNAMDDCVVKPYLERLQKILDLRDVFKLTDGRSDGTLDEINLLISNLGLGADLNLINIEDRKKSIASSLNLFYERSGTVALEKALSILFGEGNFEILPLYSKENAFERPDGNDPPFKDTITIPFSSDDDSRFLITSDTSVTINNTTHFVIPGTIVLTPMVAGDPAPKYKEGDDGSGDIRNGDGVVVLKYNHYGSVDAGGNDISGTFSDVDNSDITSGNYNVSYKYAAISGDDSYYKYTFDENRLAGVGDPRFNLTVQDESGNFINDPIFNENGELLPGIYPTSHVNLTTPLTEINDGDLRKLFYQLSPINLVLVNVQTNVDGSSAITNFVVKGAITGVANSTYIKNRTSVSLQPN